MVMGLEMCFGYGGCFKEDGRGGFRVVLRCVVCGSIIMEQWMVDGCGGRRGKDRGMFRKDGWGRYEIGMMVKQDDMV